MHDAALAGNNGLKMKLVNFYRATLLQSEIRVIRVRPSVHLPHVWQQLNESSHFHCVFVDLFFNAVGPR